ncbi:hypothetical protein BJV78DRAFT_1178907 [Lactifluus subvellereus]|nr:hypothetical protein BJV78DRAFT_1178907 [Lactifluus subvellereus]
MLDAPTRSVVIAIASGIVFARSMGFYGSFAPLVAAFSRMYPMYLYALIPLLLLITHNCTGPIRGRHHN